MPWDNLAPWWGPLPKEPYQGPCCGPEANGQNGAHGANGPGRGGRKRLLRSCMSSKVRRQEEDVVTEAEKAKEEVKAEEMKRELNPEPHEPWMG